MTNTKHTPGPWRTDNNIGRKSELGVVADAAPCVIATMCNAKAWPVEAKANARLIAAAPDLLAALEKLIDHVAITNIGKRDGVIAISLDHGRAAIAKAKGES